MKQPQAFIDPARPSYICKLHRAIVGLKQAPRARFHRFSSQLLQHGFISSKADTSMFVRTSTSGIIVLLLYVDDIINSSGWVTLWKELGKRY